MWIAQRDTPAESLHNSRSLPPRGPMTWDLGDTVVRRFSLAVRGWGSLQEVVVAMLHW